LSASVKTWAEEKTKADKEAKKSGGRANLAVAAATGGATGAAKPKTVGTASAKNTYDLGAYGDEVLDDGDDLDFM
jgi:translation initiation factor 3 subunit J